MAVKWTPHDYQCHALSFWLSRPACGLFMDPGLGKTSISLSASRIRRGADQAKGTLVVAPLTVCRSTWPREAAKWDNFKNLKVCVMNGPAKWNKLWQPHDIYCINPEGLKALHAELLRGLKAGNPLPFNALIVDECTKFKNPTGKRFELLRDMLPLFKYRSILTGTPSPKSLIDLWAQVFILDGGKALGDNFYKFRRRYFYTEDWNKFAWIPKDFAQEEILGKISHLVLNMDASDHLDMPELLVNTVPVTMPEKAMGKYAEMENELFTEIENTDIGADNAAQLTLKCRQLASGRIYESVPEELQGAERREFLKTRKVLMAHSAKQDAIRELFDELNGKPLLIAYNFKHDLEALQEVFGKDLPYIGSGTTAARQNKLEDAWNRGELPVLAGNPASMAHGLNFQKGGNDIAWYSPTWDLEMFIQFNTRIYRQGVNGKQVRIHLLTASGTIEELMYQRLNDKDMQQKTIRSCLTSHLS